MAVSDFLPTSSSSSHRAAGPASFVAAVLVIGLFAIAALDRVGAPEGLVRALGPALTLIVFAGAGLSARNADLPSFLAAGRRLDVSYGAFALLLFIAGLAFCLYGRNPASGAANWPSAVAVAAGVFGLGPLLRRFGATWRSDVIATRFPSWPVRWASGVAMLGVAALTAYAGFRGASGVLVSEAGADRAQAEAIVSAAIALGSIPGGVASLVVSAAAGAGALLAMLAAAILLKGGFPLAGASLFNDSIPRTGLIATIATAVATGGFFVLDPPAVTSRNSRASLRSARGALVLCFALAAAIVWIAPLQAPVEVTDAAIKSLTGGAALAAYLAVACVGVHGCSRALGIVLDAPPRPFPLLASVRLARIRAVHLLAIAACVAADERALVEPEAALTAAMAFSLAFTLPLLGLAALRRAGSLAASAALAVGLALFAFRLQYVPRPVSPGSLIETGLVAAIAAFILGALVSLVAPRQGQASRPFESFADPSG